jgi:hypothetical protein
MRLSHLLVNLTLFMSARFAVGSVSACFKAQNAMCNSNCPLW